jgi:hypothetical protein
LDTLKASPDARFWAARITSSLKEFAARKHKSLARKNKFGCAYSGNASAPPNTAVRG